MSENSPKHKHGSSGLCDGVYSVNVPFHATESLSPSDVAITSQICETRRELNKMARLVRFNLQISLSSEWNGKEPEGSRQLYLALQNARAVQLEIDELNLEADKCMSTIHNSCQPGGDNNDEHEDEDQGKDKQLSGRKQFVQLLRLKLDAYEEEIVEKETELIQLKSFLRTTVRGTITNHMEPQLECVIDYAIEQLMKEVDPVSHWPYQPVVEYL